MTENNELPLQDIKSMLQPVFGNNIDILETNWKHLTDPGENFGSLILAINLDILINNVQQKLHVVAKLPPPSIYLMKLFNSPLSFEKELVFYRDLTPAFLELQREYGILDYDSTWLGPKYYGGRLGINDNLQFDEQASILLENLTYSGFKVIDRLSGLNKSQTEFAVKQLAKLHAVAIAMREKKPKFFRDTVLPALGSVANEHAKECIMDMINKSVIDLGKIPEAEPYMDKIHWTIEHAPKIEADVKPDEKWRTFIHNDFWVNNMMFKFDEINNNDIIDMKIIDFQLGFYDYGVKDLIFFLVSSTQQSITEEIFDEMISLYYNAFISSLKSYKIDVDYYTRERFFKLVDFCGPQKLAQSLMMIQVIKSVPGSSLKMEDIDNKECFLQIGGGQVYHDKLIQVLHIFKNRGWLLSK